MRTGMRTRWVLVTITAIVLLYIGINAMLLKVMNVTLVLVVDIVLWIGFHLFINQRIKIYSKDHPEAASSVVQQLNPEE